MSAPSLPDLVGIAIALLAASLFVAVLAERFRIPPVVALLIVALPIRLPFVPANFAHALQFVFLPALVFEAAWNLDVASLRRRALGIALLAGPGVVASAFAVAGGLSALHLMRFLPALLLGAILSATDPIAVIPIFRVLGVPKDLATIVEGESLFNDGAAFVMYGIVLQVMVGAGAGLTPLSIGWEALAVSLGGAAIGTAVALAIAYFLRRAISSEYEIVGTIVAAFGAYLIADHFRLSGIFAAVAAGIAMRLSPRFPRAEAVEEVDRFWGVLAFLANAFVFVLMGLRIEFTRIAHEPAIVFAALALLIATRIVLAYVVLPVAERSIERGWKSVVAYSGMRGALSVALAIGLPDAVAMRAQIVDAVFGVVAITLVVQGLTIGPFVRRLLTTER